MIVEMARSILKEKNLSDKFWGESIATVVYLLNRSPTKAVVHLTPYEAWTERKPDVEHLRVFGCPAYALIHHRGKLDDKSVKCVFTGY